MLIIVKEKASVFGASKTTTGKQEKLEADVIKHIIALMFIARLLRDPLASVTTIRTTDM